MACAPKVHEVELPVEAEPDNFSNNGQQMIPEKWWRAFNDPVLNQLVDTALTANLELAGSWEQFQASIATVKSQRSFLFPDIQAEARTGISRPQPDFAGGENSQVGLSASYEIDLWGRIRTGIEAEEFRAQATYFDYQAAAMTISAETALSLYQLVSARKELQLIEEQVQTNENILKLLRTRYTSGQIRAVDILRQEQLVESTRNQKIIFETNVELVQNQLAVLLGFPPQNDLEIPDADFPKLPDLPETGLPLELTRRRPDIKQAYSLVLAADRDMAQAIRNKYPRISLNLVAQARSNDFNSLFQDWAYTLAGNIVGPIIYGGRLNAEVDRTKALKNQRLYEYGQTVLTAFREVEDALIRELKQKERIISLKKQLELAAKTNKQLKLSFLNGLTDYLDVLLSIDQEQQLQRDMINARQQLLEIRISLYRALAGSFETERAVELSDLNYLEE
ncbi:efflux transporter outer membrane subunit [Christiangramia sediminis]|uniref:Efflux transporter outer membrane subunit n=1 Tax=Christiangramia sediminis TaxID=2881336 RepID=A0A9X1LG76_9FLAO|nr:efflux transporter outer membrane subunit [Christiangramia sediminis]MCB7479708.1 efflux transporter outer membrane subunit [Christiangramia sediminis]